MVIMPLVRPAKLRGEPPCVLRSCTNHMTSLDKCRRPFRKATGLTLCASGPLPSALGPTCRCYHHCSLVDAVCGLATQLRPDARKINSPCGTCRLPLHPETATSGGLNTAQAGACCYTQNPDPTASPPGAQGEGNPQVDPRRTLPSARTAPAARSASAPPPSGAALAPRAAAPLLALLPADCHKVVVARWPGPWEHAYTLAAALARSAMAFFLAS